MIIYYMKYIFLLISNWLQLDLFINEKIKLSSITEINFILYWFFLINCVVFFIYYINNFVKKIYIQEKFFDKYFFVINIIFIFILSYIYFNNIDMYKDMEMNELILEFSKIFIIFLTTILSIIFEIVFRINKKNKILINYELWNTFNTQNKLFLILFLILYFLITLFDSQIIPFMNRNYWVFLKYLFIIYILWNANNNSLIFKQSRIYFYLLFISFVIYMSIDFLINIFIFDPILRQTLSDNNISLKFVNIKDLVYIFFIIILYIKCISVFNKEKKINRIKK